MTSLLLVAAIQLSASPTQPDQFRQACQQSIDTGRPLVVLIGANWCLGCRTMKTSILPKVAKAGGLDNVGFVYVDTDHQPRLAGQLSRAKAIPQLIRFSKTPDGWRSQHIVGAQSVQEVAFFIRTGMTRAAAAKKLAPRVGRETVRNGGQPKR